MPAAEAADGPEEVIAAARACRIEGFELLVRKGIRFLIRDRIRMTLNPMEMHGAFRLQEVANVPGKRHKSVMAIRMPAERLMLRWGR